MLTYSFENKGSDSLYEYLYKQIKQDILSLKLKGDERLPSKRALAKNLNISTITVENAYNQLMTEGYIYSVAKSGFFVSPLALEGNRPAPAAAAYSAVPCRKDNSYSYDFTSNTTSADKFPFKTWTRIMREIMTQKQTQIMSTSPSVGVWELRSAIAEYLFQFRGMKTDPDCIIIGAGTEYLYSLIIQLLGRGKTYAVEDPGYEKISRIYKANGVRCSHVALDNMGIDVSLLEKSRAQVLHISPSHHFPTGIATPVGRRYELLCWAAESPGRYIIEDDYDSEFRFSSRPVPTLQSIDTHGKVIYINTFSKSLTPTIRISYMVLPEALMKKYKKELNFYSCTVANFEQYTLAEFISKGYFEKHINRMRNYYRGERDCIMTAISRHPLYHRVKIKEENSGLHFLMSLDTCHSDEELTKRAAAAGIRISFLSRYYHSSDTATEHTLIVNYSAIPPDSIPHAIDLLFRCLLQ